MAGDDIQRYRDNLRDELDGAALYTAIAAAEPDPLRKDLFLQLAQAEARHAELWRGKLAAAGIAAHRATICARRCSERATAWSQTSAS